MSSAEKEKVYMLGPQARSTPERWRARFNTMYQAKTAMQIAAKEKVTQKDYDQYRLVHPEESAKLDRMHALSRLSGMGTLTGLVAGTATCYRWTKSPPLIATGMLFSTVAGFFVATDIGSWVYGTYKFDRGDTNVKFVKWVEATRHTSD